MWTHLHKTSQLPIKYSYLFEEKWPQQDISCINCSDLCSIVCKSSQICIPGFSWLVYGRMHKELGHKDGQSFLRWFGIKTPTVSSNKQTQSKHPLESIHARWIKRSYITQLRLLFQVIVNNISPSLWRPVIEILRSVLTMWQMRLFCMPLE